MHQLPVVIMGVSGSGKTTLGLALADTLNRPFIDADDLHTETNRLKMRAGVPLTDQDRDPWLTQVGHTIAQLCRPDRAPIVACSALKVSYRQLLRQAEPQLRFVYLAADCETVALRIAEREHPYMPLSLLQSQFDTLEPPHAEDGTLQLDIREPVDALTNQAAAWLVTLEHAHTSLAGTR